MALRVNTLSGNQLFNFANGMMRITVIAEKINQADADETRPLISVTDLQRLKFKDAIVLGK